MNFTTYRGALPAKTTLRPDRAGATFFTKGQVLRGEACGLVVAGEIADGVYCLPYDQHTLTGGLSGCGKTRSVVLPSVHVCGLSELKPHLVISDCKLTTYLEASGFLASQGYRIRHVNLRSKDSPNKFNVLHPAWEAHRSGDGERCEATLTDVLDSLVQCINDKNDMYWQQSASTVFTAVFYALCERKEHSRHAPTVADIVEVTHRSKPELELFVADASTEVAANLRVALSTVLHDVEKTWTCIQNVIGSMCRFYTSPLGLSVTGETNFDPAEDFLGDVPTALFITCPDDSGAADDYVSSFFEGIVYKRYVHGFEERGLERSDSKPVVAFMDEIARFPKCGLSAILAAGRSRRFFVNLFVQSFSQFLENDHYTENEAAVLLENCRTTIYMGGSSKRIGDDAEIKSYGRIDAKDIATLTTGEAFISAISKPTIRVRMEPLDRYREHGMLEWHEPASAEVDKIKQRRPRKQKEKDERAA